MRTNRRSALVLASLFITGIFSLVAGATGPDDRTTAKLTKRYSMMGGNWTGTCSGSDFKLPISVEFNSNAPEESGLGRLPGNKGYWVLFTPLDVKLQPKEGEGLGTQRKEGGWYKLTNPAIHVCDEDAGCVFADNDDSTFGILKVGTHKFQTVRLYGDTAYRGQALTLTGRLEGKKYSGDCVWSHLTKVSPNYRNDKDRITREGTFELLRK